MSNTDTLFVQVSGGSIVQRSMAKRELWDKLTDIDLQVSLALSHCRNARVGHAKIKVVGTGALLIAHAHNQRPINVSHVNNLLASFNHNGCLPFEPENVATIAVRTGWVNPASVTPEITPALRPLRFANLPAGEYAVLLNGQHRIQALNKRLKPLVQQASQLKAKIDKASAGPALTRMENELKALQSAIEHDSWWGVVIYNLGVSTAEAEALSPTIYNLTTAVVYRHH